jgi:agmatine deiminase
MAWPSGDVVLTGTDGAEGAFRAWAAVAEAIAEFEPVTMLVPLGEGRSAATYLRSDIMIVELEIRDSWMRDFGPTFVLDSDSRLCGVDWTFNGWGGRSFPDCRTDALVARQVVEQAGAQRIVSKLVNEGGAIHTDGEGTVLLTETVQLNPNRNPNWSKPEVEAEIHRLLGTEVAIWLPAGLASDFDDTGTDGHVDTLACFARPGVVLAHRQPDPAHPDFESCRESIAFLERMTDARGRTLEVVALDAPAPVTKATGEPLSLSYVNFSFVNGGIVACAFDDPRDGEMAELFAGLFADRRVVQLHATRIFEGGGGIPCITQQEPVTQRFDTGVAAGTTENDDA